ncbi:sulfite reductase flavoprotein subunit alpha [Dyella soli]|uniref:NADPH--hemoprotein reductase n=2 Tax=Dyella soli TaxID=522319 RepID=A0A4R0YR22_9GAMM|nr:sulfite reductase flavoprotein subunit alpha [Dyella soli]
MAWGNRVLLAALAVLGVGLLALHSGEWEWHDPGKGRWLVAAAVLVAWSAFTAWLAQRRRRVARPGEVPERSVEAPPGDVLWIAFASQTGHAEQLAQQTATSLQQAGVAVSLVELGSLDADRLARCARMLFIVSTTGEGDAPDSAANFVSRWMRAPLPLGHLHYGLLALGDSDYDDFCGFGRQLQHWLQRGGAQSWFDAVEVDDGDPSALRHWQHHLSLLSGAAELPDWVRPDYQRWQLVERRLLNPQGTGGPCFHLALRPLDGEATWHAGDLVEIGPRHAPEEVERWLAQQPRDGNVMVEHLGQRATLREWLASSHLPAPDDVSELGAADIVAALQALPHREYSVASLPADGSLQLLVRRMWREDGTPGIGSGWLAEHACVGGEIALRIRGNSGFHAPRDDRPLILIGNGTGLAGLRALLKAREAAGHARNWLLFGERQSAHDFYHRDEIEQWQRDGHLARLDLAWSRDGAGKVYVQDLLRGATEELRQWVASGAAIYVCGSLAGMAPGVDAALRDVLGDDKVAQLRDEGRYRRDVY